MQGAQESGQKSTVLRVDQEQQQFVFTDVASEPVPSLLRDFSAPVKMEVKGQTDEDLIFLLAHDTGWLAAANTHSQCALTQPSSSTSPVPALVSCRKA